MKKILFAIFALAISAPSMAQYSSGGFSLDKENVYYGIRIGMTSAGIGGDLKTNSSRVGMTLAGIVGLRVSNYTPVFLESGLYYTERGGKSKYGGAVETKMSLNYLEIPVLIKYGFKATDDIAVLPFVGPYFALKITGDDELEIPSVGKKDLYKSADMGFKIGCGAEYNKIYAELGYQFGVTDISNIDGADARNHALFFNFGINF